MQFSKESWYKIWCSHSYTGTIYNKGFRQTKLLYYD